MVVYARLLVGHGHLRLFSGALWLFVFVVLFSNYNFLIALYIIDDSILDMFGFKS